MLVSLPIKELKVALLYETVKFIQEEEENCLFVNEEYDDYKRMISKETRAEYKRVSELHKALVAQATKIVNREKDNALS